MVPVVPVYVDHAMNDLDEWLPPGHFDSSNKNPCSNFQQREVYIFGFWVVVVCYTAQHCTPFGRPPNTIADPIFLRSFPLTNDRYHQHHHFHNHYRFQQFLVYLHYLFVIYIDIRAIDEDYYRIVLQQLWLIHLYLERERETLHRLRQRCLNRTALVRNRCNSCTGTK